MLPEARPRARRGPRPSASGQASECRELVFAQLALSGFEELALLESNMRLERLGETRKPDAQRGRAVCHDRGERAMLGNGALGELLQPRGGERRQPDALLDLEMGKKLGVPALLHDRRERRQVGLRRGVRGAFDAAGETQCGLMLDGEVPQMR